MPHKAPAWWYGKTSLPSLLLTPAGIIWDLATRLRWAMARPYRSKLPVVCIGNFTAGGAGKTPAAIAIARLLIGERERPIFLTRGYGGTVQGPHLVNPGKDAAKQVGDEPLLLARIAPVIVSADRAAGARYAEEQKASVIIMDDGFQNPGLVKDLSLLVVDRSTGIGNGLVIPAGPLRAGLSFQLEKARGLILSGTGSEADHVAEYARNAGLTTFESELIPYEDTDWLKTKPVIAFSGIGHPDKFFQTLDECKCNVIHRATYPDHYVYTASDADELLDLARQKGAQLVTTEKDLVRIGGAGSVGLLKKSARALPVRLQFRDQGKVKRLLGRTISRA